LIIKKNSDVPVHKMEGDQIKNVYKKVLIGPDDGSEKIIMRKFKVYSGGKTPHHIHEHEHVVKIEKGKGLVVDGNGEQIYISAGQSLFIPGREKHQFKNPYKGSFEFLCIILNQDIKE